MASPGKTLNARERSVSVNFVCQRCCQPLKLDLSFGCLEEQTVAELTSPVYPHSDVRCMPSCKVPDSEDYDVSRKVILPLKLTDSGNGFMLVSDSSLGSDSLNEHLRVSSRLFDIMSDQSDVDHPLCEECTDYLLDQMDQQLKIAEDECRDYQHFLECLKAEQEEQEDIEKIKEELENLKSEEAHLQIELQDGEEKKQQLEKAVKECEDKQEILQQEEERYWHEFSNLNQELLLCEDEFRSAENQLHYAQAQLDKLKKTNVFNATFHIWHSGHFGTINSFRLGRLPSVPVDWSEINAAWGQTVLLLYSLAKKMNLTFQRYRLVPYGNHSFLESLDDKSKELPLYGSGGFKFLWDTKFDQAMVAFLDCLQQFKEEVEKGETGFRLPYRMEKGKIEDSNSGNTYSIKIQFNSEEQWTKALKFMLTNLKWGLAWVSSQFSNR